MSEEKKYREFYLQTDNKDIQTFEFFASEHPFSDTDIHVIEYSAIEELEKKLEICKEALEWHQGKRPHSLAKQLLENPDQLKIDEWNEKTMRDTFTKKAIEEIGE